jgi:hypothetical protein
MAKENKEGRAPLDRQIQKDSPDKEWVIPGSALFLPSLVIFC